LSVARCCDSPCLRNPTHPNPNSHPNSLSLTLT
jgi:hypothetical protein